MHDDDDILNLTNLMEQNYHALQNFLKGVEVETPVNRGGQFTKNKKKKERKVELVRAQGCKCVDCGVAFTEVDGRFPDATADHVIPHRYGSNLSYNCEFVCNPCNQAREHNRMAVIMKFFGSIA